MASSYAHRVRLIGWSIHDAIQDLISLPRWGKCCVDKVNGGMGLRPWMSIVVLTCFGGGLHGCTFFEPNPPACILDFTIVTTVCGKCQKGDWFAGDFVKFTFALEAFEQPNIGESLDSARRVWSEVFDNDQDNSCILYSTATSMTYSDGTGHWFEDGVCPGSGRLTVTGMLCNRKPGALDCSFDKTVVIVKEWIGEDTRVDPSAKDDLRVEKTLSVSLCKDP